MAKLSTQHYEKLKRGDEIGELYLRCLKKMERAEKMNRDELTAYAGKDGEVLLEQFRLELDGLQKKGF